MPLTRCRLPVKQGLLKFNIARRKVKLNFMPRTEKVATHIIMSKKHHLQIPQILVQTELQYFFTLAKYLL